MKNKPLSIAKVYDCLRGLSSQDKNLTTFNVSVAEYDQNPEINTCEDYPRRSRILNYHQYLQEDSLKAAYQQLSN